MNKTINYYNAHHKDFIINTLNANASNLHHYLLKHLPIGSTILDLGCGSGRDSKIFLTQGYKICAVDGSKELCTFASEYIGQQVICKTFDELDFENEFDGVWACASLLHIPYTDLPNIFQKISRALKAGGYFYASFKYGDFEGERNDRYFTDLTEERLESLLEPFHELSIIETTITGDIRIGKEDEKWLNVVIKK